MSVKLDGDNIIIEAQPPDCFILDSMEGRSDYGGRIDSIIGINARTKRWGVYCFLLTPRQAHLEIGQGGKKIVSPHSRAIWEILIDIRKRFHVSHLHLKKARWNDG